MGANSEIIFKKEINEADDQEATVRKAAEHADLFANPYTAAQRGFIDEADSPEDTIVN
jgi:propionyl-CoA carboxylase beta chain